MWLANTMRGGKAAAHVAARVLLIACLACSLLFCLAGCKDSDALKEIVFDQQSGVIDYDNPDKFLINDPTSDIPSELVSAIDRQDSSRVTDEVQNVVVYSSDPNTEGNKTKNSVFDYDPAYTGIEASKGVRFVMEEQEASTPPEPPQVDDSTDAETSAAQVVQAKTEERSEQADVEKEGAQNDEEAETQDPDESTGPTADADETPEGAGAGDQVAVASDTTSAFSDPPEVGSIAAYGEYAVIVQMLGGKGALAAADAETLGSKFSTVFASHIGEGGIATGWIDDGETAENMDVDAIIGSGAQTILVPSSDYGKAGNGLTSTEVSKLNKAGITLTVIYPLTNSTYIKETVGTVAKMLAKSDSIEFDPSAKADAYVKFHDGLIDKCVNANGGLAGSKVYEQKNATSYGTNSSAHYTLLVDDYDISARFVKTIGGVSLDTNGVGIATFNYSQTPVSYYIQAGGLVNTGAAKTTESQLGRIAVWQFNTNIRSFKKSYWTYDETGLFAKCADIASGSSAGWDYVLTTCSTERNGLSVTGDTTVLGLTASFGSSQFKRIIAGTQQVKSKMIENSKSATGLYHAYGIPKGDYNPATYGLAYSDTGILYSSIGIDGANGIVEDFEDGVIPDDSICVTPHGLFDSWLEGTLESCLEAAWVTDVVNGAHTVGYGQYVKDFYQDVYGYALSDAEYNQIIAGVEK